MFKILESVTSELEMHKNERIWMPCFHLDVEARCHFLPSIVERFETSRQDSETQGFAILFAENIFSNL